MSFLQPLKHTLRQDDIETRVRDDLTETVHKDKRNLNMLTNMYFPVAESDLCDECGNAMKPAIVQDYTMHMEYVDKSDRKTNTYSISTRGGNG
jgi:hypothetical protein